ncbi:MAG: metallophosphoesterase [Phycisphaerae bacterium]|nr:metallophosphoesterase [Tepidisphaeraceae bacterium]
MIDRILASVRPAVRHRVWVISDLQQSVPAEAKRCLTAAVADFTSLDMPPEQIWYLGDAVEGNSLPHLEEMAAMQVEVLSALRAPVRYVLGNHDFDHLRDTRFATKRHAIFHDAVRRTPGWRTTESIDQFHFVDRIGPFTVVFLSDHAAADDGRWYTTHGVVHGDRAAYPHSPADYRALRDEIAKFDGPVITCAHYAFAGGNRPSPLMDQMLPLPANVRLHLYGHAHIGDAAWAGKDLFRKLACVDDHPVVQADVASLEDARGSAIRSAVLEVYDDSSLGLYFRNHSTRRWEDLLVLDGQRFAAR